MNTWVLTDAHINDLQTDSINRLIERCKHAHYVNVHVRINGKDEHFEADWLKYIKPVTAPADVSQLMSFYDAADKDELIERLHHHIERLQAKLPAANEYGRSPREG